MKDCAIKRRGSGLPRLAAVVAAVGIGLSGPGLEAAPDQSWEAGSVIEIEAYADHVVDDDWTQAIKQALADAEEGDTLHFCDTTPTRLVDGEFVIDRTMRLTMAPDAEIRLRGRDTDGKNAELYESGRTHIFHIKADDVVFDGVNVDVNSRNNYHLDENENRIFYARREHEAYPNGVGGIRTREKETGGAPSGVRILNGRVTNTGTSGVSVRGEDIEVRHMILEKCVRDAISIHEAENVKIHDNHIRNTLWHSIHVYRHSEHVSVKRNQVISKGLDDSLTNAWVNHGILVGHGSRSTGTVHHVTVEDNLVLASHNSSGISVLKDVTNVDVLNNRVLGARTGVRLSSAGEAIRVEGNRIAQSNLAGIDILGDGTRNIVIRENRVQDSWMEPEEGPMGSIHFSDDDISRIEVLNNHCRKGTGNSTHSIRLGPSTTDSLVRGNFVPQGILDEGSGNRLEHPHEYMP